MGDDSAYWPTPDEVAAHYPILGNGQTIDLSTEEWVDDGAHWKGKLLKINNLKSAVEALKNVVVGVQTTVSNHETRIAALEKTLTALHGHKVLAGSQSR